MKKIKISVNNKEYTVKLARTEEEQIQGLQNITELPKDEGMLFVFNKESEQGFWMKNTLIPLDIVFISDTLQVNSVESGTPNSEELINGYGMYVLEVNSDSGIQKGDSLEFNSEKNLNKMLVLDSNGDTQMELKGGERIFSRPHTKILIRFAKKADSLETDNAYKALGKRVFKFLNIQENTPKEYV